MFIKKVENFKCYKSGNYIYYNQVVTKTGYFANLNSTSLQLWAANFTENKDLFYNGAVTSFYSTVSIYTDNTYTSFF